MKLTQKYLYLYVGLLYKRLQDLDSSFMKSKQKLCEDWIKESEEMKVYLYIAM